MPTHRHQRRNSSAPETRTCLGGVKLSTERFNQHVPVDSPHKGQWRGALMFSLICAWTNDWVNNRDAGDLRRSRAHYDVSFRILIILTDYIHTELWQLLNHALASMAVWPTANELKAWMSNCTPHFYSAVIIITPKRLPKTYLSSTQYNTNESLTLIILSTTKPLRRLGPLLL